MKRTVLFFYFSALTMMLNAQVSIKDTVENFGGSYLWKIELNSGHEKFYQYFGYDTNKIVLYNLDMSIYKTIDIPDFPDTNDYEAVMYISDNLFDTDDKIEYLLFSYNWIKIYNEDGLLKFAKDSVTIPITTPAAYDAEVSEFIFNTYEGTIMILQENTGNYDFLIYDLPGVLPCDLCEGSIVGKKSISEIKKSLLSQSFPNPSKDFTRIDYKLPDGTTSGTITLYDIRGRTIKTYIVESDNDNLEISTRNLRPGTYYYNLTTENGVSQGKKMIKIR